MTKTSKRWIQLTDMSATAIITTEDFSEVRRINRGNVKYPLGRNGLRRTVLLESGNSGSYTETNETVDLTPQLVSVMRSVHNNHNSWNYDWPNFANDAALNTPEALARVKASLEAQMARQPYEFKVLGLDGRILWYFSDGSYDTQKYFEDLCPPPGSNPYFEDGSLNFYYRLSKWNHLDRDKKRPRQERPDYLKASSASERPLIYRGPAYAVRFELDGQEVLIGNARVYVDENGEFLCSDWCQRNDFETYGGGINLQLRAYSFDEWVVGPMLHQNEVKSGSFVPKRVVSKREAYRDLVKKTGTGVPSFEEALKKAESKLDEQRKLAGAVKPSSLQVRFAQAKGDADAVLTQLDQVFAGTAPLDELRDVPVLFPVTSVLSEYMSTFTGCTVTVHNNTPHFELRITDTTCTMTPCEPGEVCLMSPLHFHEQLSNLKLDRARATAELEKCTYTAEDAPSPFPSALIEEMLKIQAVATKTISKYVETT